MHHAQSPPDASRRMMAFNWLPAAYAHADWLAPWALLVQQRDALSFRVLQRLSMSLLDRYGLRHRYLRDVGDHDWILASHDDLTRIARELGTAMLGGWVRLRLERQHVSAQTLVLGAQGRRQALQYALVLRALLLPLHGNTAADRSAASQGPQAWGLQGLDGHTTVRLGLSCMAALLDDRSTGARERFILRFANGVISPIALDAAQRREALQLILDTQHSENLLSQQAPLAPLPNVTRQQTEGLFA